jgi:hypothetical protein
VCKILGERTETAMEDVRTLRVPMRVDQRGPEAEASALTYLQSVYRDPLQPTSVRMRAASIAIPFESAKLTAVALVDGGDFGSRLDAAIARGHGEMKAIEHRANEGVEQHDPSELER